MRGGQMGLLLWKNYVVRKRRPAIQSLIFLWPIVIFMLLYIVRDNVDMEYSATCQFPARLMPRDGLLPFVQSYICTIGNPCESLDNYEQVPSYENATLGPLIMEIQPILTNSTVITAVKTLPQSIQFLKSMAEILTQPEIKKIFDRGIKLGDLFKNHDIVSEKFKEEIPLMRDHLVDDLFQVSIQLYYLIESFGSSNIDSILCSPDSLRQFLIVPREQDLSRISETLCTLDSNKIPIILERIAKHLDFTGLLEAVSRVMGKFKNYDFIMDITKTINTVLELETIKKYVPSYLKLKQWIPEILSLFRDIDFKTIDVSFINKSIAKMDPIFADDHDWSIARDGLYKLNSLLSLVKDIYIKNKTANEIGDKNPFELTQQLTENAKALSDFYSYSNDITQVLDRAYLVLQDGVKLTNKLLNRHVDEIQLATEIYDNLRDIFPNKILNSLTYLVSITENIVKITHHVAIIHEEIEARIYNISIVHKNIVKKIITQIDAEIYENFITSFGKLDLIENLIEIFKKKNPTTVICEDDIFKKIFQQSSNHIHDIICHNDTKLFIMDIYEAFEFDNFRQIVDNTLSTFVSMALSRPVSVEKSNLTSAIGSIRNLLNYLNYLPANKLNWDIFHVSNKWMEVFNKTQSQARRNILGYHLSIAKMTGSRSISYLTIKPDLEKMDIIANAILEDLHENPVEWINQIRQHKWQLLESFYLTVIDRNKVLKILEFSNFTRTYCTDDKNILLDVINYPEGSNVMLLKRLVCRLARSVQIQLEINVTTSEYAEDMFKNHKSYNWTAFNEKLLNIYSYIDSLVHFNDSNYDFKRLKELRENFTDVWLNNLSPEHGLEISVGLLCKIFNLAESPVFNVQSKPDWKRLYAVAWSVSKIADHLEYVIDDILRGNNTMKLPVALKDMPQTEILLDVTLRNLPAITRDIINIINEKNPIELMKTIKNHLKFEHDWPCVYNKSLGEALELLPGTKMVFREIERISCNPGYFIKEWKEQEIFLRLEKIFNFNDTNEISVFNWTLGYLRFRRILNKVKIIMNIYSDELVTEIKKIIDTASSKIKEDKTKDLLDYFDGEIEKNIHVFMSNMTAREAWLMQYPRGIDEILLLTKFGLKLFDNIIDVIYQMFQDNSDSLNLISILGFTNHSAVSIIQRRAPHILATIIYGLSQPDFIDEIYHNIIQDKNNFSCSHMFSLFDNYRLGISHEEIQILNNFTCDGDPEDFNSFVDIYLKGTTIWETPALNYKLYFFSLAKKLYDLAQLIENHVNNGMKINQPFGEYYFKIFSTTLKNLLKNVELKKIKFIKSSNFHLLIGFVSEILRNAAVALDHFKIINNNNTTTLHLWDFVKPGDFHQLLKYLELYPVEAISLFFTISTTLNNTTVVDFNDLRFVICNLHSHSDYWTQPRAKHFLNGLCTWDQTELIASATSEDYVNYLKKKSAQHGIKIQPLAQSLTQFLDIWLKMNEITNITVISTVFNFTTWKNLPNNTYELIYDAEKIWIHKLNYEFNFNTSHLFIDNHPLNILSDFLESIEIWMDLLSGGDIWQKLKARFDQSKVKLILNLIEDLPNLIITFFDTLINSERLGDFADKFFAGQVSGCDIDKYLIPSVNVRKKGIVFTITNFCQKILFNNQSITMKDFYPLIPTKVFFQKNNLTVNNMNERKNLNETYIFQQLWKFQSTFIQVLSDEYIQPKTPSWWTSFYESTWNNFKMQFNSKDLRLLSHSIVTKCTKVMRNILMLSPGLNTTFCEWCNTRIVTIINSQLIHHQIYSKILCNFNTMNVSQIQQIIDTQLNWRKTIGMIKNYEFLTVKKDVSSFMDVINDALHYIIDIIIDYKDPNENKHLESCIQSAVDGVKNFSPAIYAKIIVGVIDGLQKNIKILILPTNREDLDNFTKLAEKFVPIWKPLIEIINKLKIDQINKILPNATINVNLLTADEKNSLCWQKNYNCNDSLIFNNFLSSKRSYKLLIYNESTSSCCYTTMEISNLLASSLDFQLINQEINSWRSDASWSLTWLKEILRHLAIIFEESGSLLEIARKIDFQDVSNVLGMPDVVDGVVNILRDKTVDKLFDGLKEILEDIEPFLDNQEIKHDLYLIVNAFESMEIFKNLGMLDLKYIISELFLDWTSLKKFLIEDIKLSSDTVMILSQAKVDMLSVFMKERSSINFKDTLCSANKINDILTFDESNTTAKEITSVLCTLNSSSAQNIVIALIQNVNFDYVFNNLMSANVKNILKNANLTESQGKIIFDNIGVISELVPLFKDKLTSSFSSNKSKNNSTISSTMFLHSASEMLCGKSLISDSGEFYRIISTIKEQGNIYDDRELNTLPSEFCKDTYKTVLGMNGGKIIWSYVKPLIRGRILYTPKSPVIKQIITLANQTFSEIDIFGQLINSIDKTINALVNLTNMGESLNDLKNIMASKVMKLAIKSMSEGRIDGNQLANFDLSEISWKLKQSSEMIKMIEMLDEFIECVMVDRMIGYNSEDELEAEARRLMENNEFLAGVVFLNIDHDNSQAILPQNVTYKIRMDVDYVPSTKRLKNQFWIPGPEASYIEDLRYLRGFVQLQDSIDRAIIEVKSGRKQNWKTLSQQMPYPCYKFAPFQSTLYESQGLIICFFFAMMLCVGSAVRHIVWERESQNSMVMSVMGLKLWRNTFAWFITTYIELAIISVCIWTILIAGKILPYTDPTVFILLLLDYVFSIVTFCYMISTMFSSASLAAVTAVVMFLLTYMPYVIVIAMEATLGIGYSLLMCLSMSTSFCYGCLFAARREVQGTGLTWETMWEELNSGDQMSLGLVFVMITLDGILYALVGYIVVRYTNSGRGFHGLRFRSLWWATNTRSLYRHLAFVNSLYFTNDVLHLPSATHQDEDSDMSSMTVNEKQIGVQFEAVNKVFETERGQVVAVEDFTLKLCEGEITSLLGRNGAGKTTIIKMLTGMLAPTSGEIYLHGDSGTKPDIGVCPQENVLIDTLTPREHMLFYAKLKNSMNNEEMKKNVDEMLVSLDLGKQEHEPVSRLSGGTRRRLCVALAFLGSPKLVILDEPGAGVDPAARRRIWRLIDEYRFNKTVLLSTHHLDEADMLSDTVVVIHRGKILCTGSPLSLKMTYGQGYWLNVEFPQSHTQDASIDAEKMKDLRCLVESVVTNARVDDPLGLETTVNLPFQGKHGKSNDIGGVIKILEEHQKNLGFSHISLDCDTLERVFLNLCCRADTGSSSSSSPVWASTTSVASNSSTGLNTLDDTEFIIPQSKPNPTPVRQIKILLKKRMWHFMRDWRAPLAALILPTVFVAVAMGFSLIRPPSSDEPLLDLNPKLYNAHSTYFYSIGNGSNSFLQQISLQLHDRFGGDYAGAWQIHPNDTGVCDCIEGQQICKKNSKSIDEGLFQTFPGRPTLDWIISTFPEYIEKRYGGWSLSQLKEDPLFVVWFNNKGYHSLPSYLNALNEAILRASGIPGHLKTFNHPLKLSSDQLNRTSLLQHVADVGVALVLLIAFNLVAAQGARELVRERLSEEKCILYLAGVHPVTYWTAALIWDVLVFLGAISLAVIVFEIFGLSAYVARDNLAGVCLLLILYAWASIPFTHLIEKIFDDSSLANMVLFCLNTFIGVVCLATILVIDILGKSQAVKDTRRLLHNLMLIFPQYTLGDALVQMSTNDITAELLERFNMNTYKSPMSWDLIGPHYVFLFVVGVVLYLANLAVECRVLPILYRHKLFEKTVNNDKIDEEEDDDVVRERIRVENGTGNDVVKTVNLCKEYTSVYGTNVAVKNLSIGVQRGTCFGLLGVNGAGKTTAFKMLTTQLLPTAGKIILNGKKITSKPLCNGQIGYCPQNHALDGFLTAYQCLTVHSEVCGLDNVDKVVDSMLKRFDLLKYAHQRVSSLSGGNKRKLCAAISVMAPVSLVLMDEPTSGMDPASKELVARAVAQVTRGQSSVIMTSHSVAECEKLCNRVGILAKAGLRCIGTVQHIKHKFGEGHVVFLRFSQSVTAEELKDAISRHISQAQVSSRQATAARLMVPRVQGVTLSETFSRVKHLAEDLKATDYTLTQSSLDQVLVNFSEELEHDLSDQTYKTTFTNSYSSMDTIHMETF